MRTEAETFCKQNILAIINSKNINIFHACFSQIPILLHYPIFSNIYIFKNKQREFIEAG